MFIGHYSAAFIAAAHPKAPGLGTLFIGAQLVDFGFFGLTLAGIEHMRITPGMTAMNPMDLYHMPFTHSLIGSAAWAAGFALLIFALSRNGIGALIGAAVVMSHWVLDLLVHSQDLTIAGSPPKLGFGLWNYPAIEMPLEIAITFGALWWYLRATRPNGAPWAAGVMAIVLIALQAFNWFSPPPVAYDASMPISALIAFTVLSGVAYWLAQSHTAPSAGERL
jgi:hypothetical protein